MKLYENEPADEPAVDFAVPGERVNYDVEQAYRRGVEQGAHWACKLIEDGAQVSAVRTWISKRLHPWRQRIRKHRRKTDNTVEAEPVPAPRRGYCM